MLATEFRRAVVSSRLTLICLRGMLWGLVTAVVASTPAAARLSTQGQSLVVAWLGIAGLIAVPSIAAVVLGSLARRGWRELVRGRNSNVGAGVVVWLALFCPFAIVAGGMLFRTTHHRGLGGATFGAMAVGVGGLAVLLAFRWAGGLLGIMERGGQAVYSTVLAVCSGALVVTAGLVLRAASASGLGWSALSARTQVGLVDAGVWLFCVLIACGVPGPDRIGRRTRGAIFGASAVLVALGIVLPLRSPELARALEAGAPVAASVAEAGGLL